MRLIIGLMFLVGALSSCGQQPENNVTHVGSATHAERGVTVDIDVMVEEDGSAHAMATFTPDNAAWHLYDTAMSADGIDGFGRPTRLDVIAGASSTGQTTADQEAYDLPIEPLDITVPVYPDGPVTLTTPFVSTDGSVDVSLTYMSCGSGGGCTVPVVNRTVQIALTQAD